MAEIDLQIREQQAVMNQAREQISLLRKRRQELLAQHRKKRRPTWDDTTPLIRLINPLQLDAYLRMIHDWEKHTTHPIHPSKTHHFHFDSSYSLRPVYVAMAAFLSAADYPLQVPLMAFYRYLAAHSNLGSVQNIKVQLSRMRRLI